MAIKHCTAKDCDIHSSIDTYCFRHGTKLEVKPNCVCGAPFWDFQEFCSRCGRAKKDALPASENAPVENLCKTS